MLKETRPGPSSTVRKLQTEVPEVVRDTMVGMTSPFPAGLTLSLLSAKMPIAAVVDVIDTSVRQPAFLPVEEVDHRGRTFTQFRQVSNLTNYVSYTGDFVRVEFVDIPDRNYPADEEVEVILGAFDRS